MSVKMRSHCCVSRLDRLMRKGAQEGPRFAKDDDESCEWLVVRGTGRQE